jgi:hypothetical protein
MTLLLFGARWSSRVIRETHPPHEAHFDHVSVVGLSARTGRLTLTDQRRVRPTRSEQNPQAAHSNCDDRVLMIWRREQTKEHRALHIY